MSKIKRYVENEDKMRVFTIRVPDEYYEGLKRLAILNKTNVSKVVRQIIYNTLNRKL